MLGKRFKKGGTERDPKDGKVKRFLFFGVDENGLINGFRHFVAALFCLMNFIVALDLWYPSAQGFDLYESLLRCTMGTMVATSYVVFDSIVKYKEKKNKMETHGKLIAKILILVAAGIIFSGVFVLFFGRGVSPNNHRIVNAVCVAYNLGLLLIYIILGFISFYGYSACFNDESHKSEPRAKRSDFLPYCPEPDSTVHEMYKAALDIA